MNWFRYLTFCSHLSNFLNKYYQRSMPPTACSVPSNSTISPSEELHHSAFGTQGRGGIYIFVQRRQFYGIKWSKWSSWDLRYWIVKQSLAMRVHRAPLISISSGGSLRRFIPMFSDSHFTRMNVGECLENCTVAIETVFSVKGFPLSLKIFFIILKVTSKVTQAPVA